MKKIALNLFIILILSGCVGSSSSGRVSSLFFSVEDDQKLGLQVQEEIESKPSEYPMLPESKYPKSYEYIRDMTRNIVNSGNVAYKDDFAWVVKIIHDDNTLNAFCTPGGYIYVYTGLIKYLNSADDLAGVMGHEIAHADRRHSIKQLEKQYGISLLLSIALGESASQTAQIAGQLAGKGTILAFSRGAESEADEYSVRYLSGTSYACNGAATFFEKLTAEGKSGGTPTFLSTHPSPDNRAEDINNFAKSIQCATKPIQESGMTYAQFKASLP
ncbi:MAG: M48 family metalloprotease [Cyclobacteriaceae bacterium]